MANNSLKTLGLGVVRFLVRAVTVLVSALMVVACGLRCCVFNDNVYLALPEEPTFTEQLTVFVLDDLEAECLFYDLPFDQIKTAVTPAFMQTLARDYAAAVTKSLTTGTTLVSPTVDAAVYRSAVQAFFDSLPPEERPPDENAAADVADELATSTAQVLGGGGVSSRLPTLAHTLVYNNVVLRWLASAAGWLAILAVLCVAACWWLGGGDWRRRSYATAGTLFLGSALACMPLWLVHRHNLAERVALGDSPLKLYVTGVLNATLGGMSTLGWWVFAIAAVLLIGSVVALVWRRSS